VDAEQILAFRLARTGLASRDARSPAAAAQCPASDFARDAALFALAARFEGLTRKRYDGAIDRGDLVLAHIMRGAIHAVSPNRFALFGRALIATDDDELGMQLGQQIQKLAKAKKFKPTDALTEVAGATKDALHGGRALDKNELHEELRRRVSPDLMPWCRSCKSHHVAPMLWRFAGVKAGARLDSERRYVLGKPGRSPAAAKAVERFLHFYGPATAGDFAEWAGLARSHADRLWSKIEGDLLEVPLGKRIAWLLKRDSSALDSPPRAKGIRLIPPGDPYLQKPNRPLLAPDAALKKRLFRPVASPGAVLRDGRLAGLWKAKAQGKKLEVKVEKLGRLARKDVVDEAARVAELRGAAEPVVVVG
jgi:hypothetical protein